MKTGIRLFLWLVVIFMMILASAHSQENMVSVNSGRFGTPMRAAAVFHHDSHNETAGIEECSECHHLYKDGKRVEDESSEDQSCFACHALKRSGQTPSLMEAFHLNCKGCHVKQAAGPVLCGECHLR